MNDRMDHCIYILVELVTLCSVVEKRHVGLGVNRLIIVEFCVIKETHDGAMKSKEMDA